MDIKAEILKEHSKKQTVRVANYIENDKKRFNQLMNIFLHSDFRTVQRASWIVSHCAESYPELIKPHLERMMENLKRESLPDAAKRNTMRIFQFIAIPDKLLGTVANKCFEYLSSHDEAIAVKVFSMTVLKNICEKEPELKKELKLVIEGQMEYASPAFKSRAKRTLKDLQRAT